MTKLWQKGYQLNDQVERFEAAQNSLLDARLIRHDVWGSLAHIAMLTKIGVLTEIEHRVLKDAIDAFIAATQKVVNGEYTVELYKGNINIRTRSSSSGLFFPDVRSIKSASFNQKECAPAAHLRGLPFELIARRNKMVTASFEGEQS